ncbi:MAG: thioesterase family protein [Phycisphaerae bacterium]|nr:thioesterase family protein [Phycisphaerae bacterium]
MFKYPTFIRLGHTDAADVIYFVNVFDLAHHCYEAMLYEHISIREMIGKKEIIAPIVHAEADYHKPLNVSDKVEIQMTLAKMGTSSYTFNYDFINEANELAVSVRITHVVIDVKTKKAIEIPEKIKKILTGV